jgi:CheY-like chemotaxis protein
LRLFLPRAAAAAAAVMPREPAQVQALDGNGETVLVVEDNTALRRVAVRQLTRLGYAVIEADSAEVALGQLATTRVSVLFTDVVMPGGMNGFELAQRARAAQPDIKVLLTSGFPEQLADSAAIGARLLNKPYRAEDLARAVRATLHG